MSATNTELMEEYSDYLEKRLKFNGAPWNELSRIERLRYARENFLFFALDNGRFSVSGVKDAYAEFNSLLEDIDKGRLGAAEMFHKGFSDQQVDLFKGCVRNHNSLMG